MKRVISSLGLAGVALCAAVLSFASLRDLALLCGTSPSLAWLYPIAIDVAAVVATWLWLSPASNPASKKCGRWLAIQMITLSIAGNGVAHGLTAYAVSPPWWLIVAVSAVPPLALGQITHAAALSTPLEPNIADDVKRVDESNAVEIASVEKSTVDAAPVRRSRTQAKQRKTAQPRVSFKDYLAKALAAWSPGVEVSPAWVRETTGCSRGLSSRLAATVREQVESQKSSVASPSINAAISAGVA